MASYRFCRSDDVGLLVDAYNACYRPSFGMQPIDVADFKRWIRKYELWTSSCMVASEGQQLLGVLIAAKRETESCILAVGVHPEARHQDHGRHIMTSLSQKLAILGPSRMICEPRADEARVLQFLKHCDYTPEALLTDYRYAGLPAALPASMLAEISLEELASAGLGEDPPEICWGRAGRAIARRQEYFESVRVLALVGGERVEAALILERVESDFARPLLALRYHRDEAGRRAATALLRHAAGESEAVLSWDKVHELECDAETAAAFGFEPQQRYQRMVTEAVPA